MSISRSFAAAFVFLAGSAPLSATEGDQPYAGLAGRAITSLSSSDIEELERGGGWGLALPAELNGFPGPAHVLELGDALALTEDQTTQVQAIHAAMKKEAVATGRALIAAERALDAAFRAGNLNKTYLADLIGAAELQRGKLRMVHLSRHLETAGLLTQHQIEKYNQLRGYAVDPCTNVPKGHNEDMWREHMGC